MDRHARTARIALARRILDEAAAVTVLTGAGISAESGIPTFRDALTGLWEHFRPEELATPSAFLARPKVVWDWYAWRRRGIAAARPNPGHRALVRIEQACTARGADFVLVTQNVDGLHQAAGSRNVFELHGNIRRIRCFQGHCGAETWAEGDDVPTCPRCGALLRPDVVWFGESLPAIPYAAAIDAAKACQVFLCAGTSGLVEPAASLPFMALDAGARVIEVNPAPTPLTPHATISLAGAGGEILPRLCGGEPDIGR